MKNTVTYRRKVFPHYGDPNVFQWETQTTRPLAEHEVLIQVKYIGINFADIIARKGFYKWAKGLPFCPGFEISGTIEDTGAKSTFKIGSNVMAVTKFGGYSEYLIADKNRVKIIPKNMSYKEAASIPVVYITAYHSLIEVLRIRKGEDILIQAVAGGVGIAALQIAKAKGLIVFGTASTNEKLQFAQIHGLDYGINYKTHDFELEISTLTNGKGIKFLLDSLGGHALKKGIRCLSSPGNAVTIGATSIIPSTGFSIESLIRWGKIVSDFVKGGIFHPFYLIEKNQGISGVQILLLWDNIQYLNQIINKIIDLYNKNLIKPHIDKVFPLEEVGKAHEFIEQRYAKGKILLSTQFA